MVALKLLICPKMGNINGGSIAVNAGGQAGGKLMVGKIVDQIVRQQVKAAANWRCQNPDCQRECLRPGETLQDLLARQRQGVAQEGQLELDLRSQSDAIQPYIMKAVPDGYGGYLALCGSCAIQFVQPAPQPRFQQTKRELLGQLRLL